MASKTIIKKKDIPFLDFWHIKDLTTKKIKKTVIPRDTQIGYEECDSTLTVKGPIVSDCQDATSVLLGGLIVCGTLNAGVISGTGEINTGDNVGAGSGLIFRDKTGVTLNFKTLLQGSNITITNNADDITIAASTGTTPPWTDVLGVGNESSGFDARMSSGDDLIMEGGNIRGTDGTTGQDLYAVGGSGSSGLGGNLWLMAGNGSVSGSQVFITQEVENIPVVTLVSNYNKTTEQHNSSFFVRNTPPDTDSNNEDPLDYLTGSFVINVGAEPKSFPQPNGHGTYPGLYIKRVDVDVHDESWELAQCRVTGSIISSGIQVGSIGTLNTLFRVPRNSEVQHSIGFVDLNVQGVSFNITSEIRGRFARKIRAHVVLENLDDTVLIPRFTYEYFGVPITEGEGTGYDARLLTIGTELHIIVTGSSGRPTEWRASYTPCDMGGNILNSAQLI